MWIFFIFLVCLAHISTRCHLVKDQGTECVLISLQCHNTRNYIHFLLSSPWTGVTDVINDLLDTFPNTVHIMLNIEPQIEKIVLHFYKKIQ